MTLRPMDATLAADDNSEMFRVLYSTERWVCGTKLYESMTPHIHRFSGTNVASIRERPKALNEN